MFVSLDLAKVLVEGETGGDTAAAEGREDVAACDSGCNVDYYDRVAGEGVERSQWGGRGAPGDVAALVVLGGGVDGDGLGRRGEGEGEGAHWGEGGDGRLLWVLRLGTVQTRVGTGY